MPLTLSVTDQSPMRRGEPPASALRDTVLVAQAAERLGYERYWVAEHHNTGTYAGTSPEILVGQLLANTSRIRVGSGGVMLSHYSALKVAGAVLRAGLVLPRTGRPRHRARARQRPHHHVRTGVPEAPRGHRDVPAAGG